MINPEGCCKYRTAAGAVKRVRVRGLIYCRKCHVQWARDFSAALNIGYAFAYAMSLESWERPRYLSTWQRVCVVSVLLSFIIYPEAFELDEGGSGLEFGRRNDMEVNGGLRTDVG